MISEAIYSTGFYVNKRGFKKLMLNTIERNNLLNYIDSSLPYLNKNFLYEKRKHILNELI